MKRLKTGITAWGIAAITGAITFGVTANAGIYDFDPGNMNDLRKAWMICSIYQFKRGDCPGILEECYKPKNRSLSGDTRCKVAPKFTNKNDDAQKALKDGSNSVDDDRADDAVAGSDEHRDTADNMDNTTDPNNPCVNAADVEACNNAMAADAAGEEGYDTGDTTASEAQQAAIDANQQPVADQLDEGFNPWADEDTADATIDTNYCDPTSSDFEACSRARAIQQASNP